MVEVGGGFVSHCAELPSLMPKIQWRKHSNFSHTEGQTYPLMCHRNRQNNSIYPARGRMEAGSVTIIKPVSPRPTDSKIPEISQSQPN